MKTRLLLQGASGKTGKLVLAALGGSELFELHAALVSPASKLLGAPVPGAPGLTYRCDLEAAADGADFAIDFSTPDSSLALARVFAGKGKPALIAATGHSDEQRAELRELGRKSAILLAANTSIGVMAMREIAAHAQSLLGPDFDVEVLEIHHRNKKDAPSGTALSLAESLCAAGPLRRVEDRASRRMARERDEIGFASLRGGDVVGEHTIYFLGEHERLEITHRVSDRSVFAAGALNLAVQLLQMGPGLYRPADLFRRKNK